MGSKLSARNHLKGKIVDVETGPIGAKIKIEVEPSDLNAFITKSRRRSRN